MVWVQDNASAGVILAPSLINLGIESSITGCDTLTTAAANAGSKFLSVFGYFSTHKSVN